MTEKYDETRCDFRFIFAFISPDVKTHAINIALLIGWVLEMYQEEDRRFKRKSAVYPTSTVPSQCNACVIMPVDKTLGY